MINFTFESIKILAYGKMEFSTGIEARGKELNIVRKENLCKFVYDLAKLIFAGIVIGGVVPLYGNPQNHIQWYIVLGGVFGTIVLALFANKILK